MNEPPLEPQPGPMPYRLGYREGFRDGYGEAERRTQSNGNDGNGKGDDDGKQDEGKQNAGEERDDSDADKKDGDKKDGDKKDGEDDQGKTPLYKRPLVVGGILLVLLILVIAAIVFWRHSSHHETTDDAFIDGNTNQVAAQIGGRVRKLYVADNQHVNAGDPLIDIDSRDNEVKVAQSRGQLAQAQGQYDQAEAQIAVQRANVAQAEANVREAEADLIKAAQDLGRYKAVNPDAVPRQQLDQAVSAERTARAKRDAMVMAARSARAQIEVSLAQVRAGKANVDAARANVDAAALQNSYARVVAPMTGRVAKRTVEPGNVVSEGQVFMAIVSEDVWVTANYKETQLTKMKPGQPVDVVVDAYPDVAFRAHVDSIQRATGAYFSMLPAENATGNYVKVVQRVPVKIVFDDGKIRDYVIGPGMSVTPDVTLP